MENKIILPAEGEVIGDKEDIKNTVVIINEDSLRRKSRETTIEEVKQRKVVERMKHAIKTCWVNGYGLAAVQVGIPIRMAWYKIPKIENGKAISGTGEEVILINAKIVEKSGYHCYSQEGCLSLPHRSFNTGRYQRVTVEGIISIDGHRVDRIEACGVEAVVLQHELHHWDGVLCKDEEVRYQKKNIPGRNDPCPCGSRIKSKRCCYR